MVYKIILLIILSYFIGNINFAIIISKHLKKDIRKEGSGNPGTMNMTRTFGFKVGLITLTLDMIKGLIPATIGYFVMGGDISQIAYIGLFISGLSAIIGHVYPVFYKFKGGKGVATTLGVFIVAEPLWFMLFFAIGVLYIILFEYGSVGSLFIIAAMVVIEAFKFQGNYVILTILFLIFAITWFAHRNNIYRILVGKENRVKLIKNKNDKHNRKIIKTKTTIEDK